MGYSCAWIAAYGMAKEKVLQCLSLVESNEFAVEYDFPIVGTQLISGWYLIIFDDIVHLLTAEEKLLALSSSCEVVICQIDEHFMSSSASLYAEGKMQWNVCHFAELGIYHLSVEGSPPNSFDHFHHEMKVMLDREGGENAGTDYFFDVPILVANAICGFRHDSKHPAEEKLLFKKILQV